MARGPPRVPRRGPGAVRDEHPIRHRRGTPRTRRTGPDHRRLVSRTRAVGRAFGAALRRALGRALLAPGIGAAATHGLRALHGVVHGLERLAGRGAARALTPHEIRLLRPVFGDAIDYGAVTVRTGGAKGAVPTLRAHVVCDDVWLPRDCLAPDGTLSALGRRTLLHEAGHLWQHRREGAGYIARALAAQLSLGARGVGTGEAYDWRADASDGTRLRDMNPEAQAELGCWIGHAVGADGELDRAALDALLANAPGVGRPATDAELRIVREAHDAFRAPLRT